MLHAFPGLCKGLHFDLRTSSNEMDPEVKLNQYRRDQNIHNSSRRNAFVAVWINVPWTAFRRRLRISVLDLFIKKLFHYKYGNFFELEYFCSNVMSEHFKQKHSHSPPHSHKQFLNDVLNFLTWISLTRCPLEHEQNRLWSLDWYSSNHLYSSKQCKC